jgi:hypothetical protein
MGFANRALYPFKSDTLQKLTTIVGDTLLQLSPAVTALQL